MPIRQRHWLRQNAWCCLEPTRMRAAGYARSGRCDRREKLVRHVTPRNYHDRDHGGDHSRGPGSCWPAPAIRWLRDLVYLGGPILNEVGAFSQVAASLGIVLTLLYVAGLVERRNRTLVRLGPESWAVIVTYLGGVAVLFFHR